MYKEEWAASREPVLQLFRKIRSTEAIAIMEMVDTLVERLYSEIEGTPGPITNTHSFNKVRIDNLHCFEKTHYFNQISFSLLAGPVFVRIKLGKIFIQSIKKGKCVIRRRFQRKV